MVKIQGYFDGIAFKALEKIDAKPNQRVIITITDEFIDFGKDNSSKKGMRGALAEYANPSLIEKEKDAWKNATVKKYDNL